MTKITAKQAKAENERIDKKNAKIRKVKNRIGILGFVGIAALLFSLLIGFSVDENQSHELTIEIDGTSNAKDLISNFTQNLPTILGDEMDKKELASDGMWIVAGGVEYKVLIGYDLRVNQVTYKVLSSEIGIKGSWTFDLVDTQNGVEIKVVEKSTTKNLGYRSSLFFNGEDLYLRNLLKGFEKLED